MSWVLSWRYPSKNISKGEKKCCAKSWSVSSSNRANLLPKQLSYLFTVASSLLVFMLRLPVNNLLTMYRTKWCRNWCATFHVSHTSFKFGSTVTSLKGIIILKGLSLPPSPSPSLSLTLSLPSLSLSLFPHLQWSLRYNSASPWSMWVWIPPSPHLPTTPLPPPLLFSSPPCTSWWRHHQLSASHILQIFEKESLLEQRTYLPLWDLFSRNNLKERAKKKIFQWELSVDSGIIVWKGGRRRLSDECPLPNRDSRGPAAGAMTSLRLIYSPSPGSKRIRKKGLRRWRREENKIKDAYKRHSGSRSFISSQMNQPYQSHC